MSLPHTPSSNCSRENTRPGRSIRNSSRRYSGGPRPLARSRPRARPAAQLDAGQAGQHPVEHHQIGRALLQPRVGLVAAGGGFDLVAFRLEIIAEQHGERLLVLDDQDACAHATSFWRMILSALPSPAEAGFALGSRLWAAAGQASARSPVLS